MHLQGIPRRRSRRRAPRRPGGCVNCEDTRFLYARAVERIRRFACAQTVLEELGTPADNDRAIDFLRLYGVAVQAIRAAGAYALLHVAGHGRAGNPCARAALEGGVTAQWATQRTDGLDRLYEAASAPMTAWLAGYQRRERS